MKKRLSSLWTRSCHIESIGALIYIAARGMGFEPDGMTDAQMKELSDVFGLPK